MHFIYSVHTFERFRYFGIAPDELSEIQTCKVIMFRTDGFVRTNFLALVDCVTYICGLDFLYSFLFETRLYPFTSGSEAIGRFHMMNRMFVSSRRAASMIALSMLIMVISVSLSEAQYIRSRGAPVQQQGNDYKTYRAASGSTTKKQESNQMVFRVDEMFDAADKELSDKMNQEEHKATEAEDQEEEQTFQQQVEQLEEMEFWERVLPVKGSQSFSMNY